MSWSDEYKLFILNEQKADLIEDKLELIKILNLFRTKFPISPDGQILANKDVLYAFTKKVDALLKRMEPNGPHKKEPI